MQKKGEEEEERITRDGGPTNTATADYVVPVAPYDDDNEDVQLGAHLPVKELCVRISSDLGVCKPMQIFRMESLDDDLQDSSAGTPLVVL
ncbi:hypothetical protein ABZP36_030143 [Zizania latifolia]